MTPAGAGYRWTTSVGLFFGGITTLLSGEMLLKTALLDRGLSFPVWLISSCVGITASLRSLFLQADGVDPEEWLHQYAVGFLAVGLNSWPWVLGVTLLWFWRAGPG